MGEGEEKLGACMREGDSSCYFRSTFRNRRDHVLTRHER